MESIDFLTSYFRFINQAEQLINTGIYPEAIKLLEEGSSIYAKYPRVHYLRGLCFVQTANWEAAIAEWESLLKSDPHHEAALVFIGLCLFNQGNIAEAEKWLKLAVETYPHSIHAHFNLFALQLKKEGPGPVIKAIAALASSAGNQAEFLFQLDVFKVKLISLYDPAEIAALDSTNVLQLKGNGPPVPSSA